MTIELSPSSILSFARVFGLFTAVLFRWTLGSIAAALHPGATVATAVVGALLLFVLGAYQNIAPDWLVPVALFVICFGIGHIVMFFAANARA